MVRMNFLCFSAGERIYQETIFLSQLGGTVWLVVEPSDDIEFSDPRLAYGRFAYLEGQGMLMFARNGSALV